MMKTFFVSVCTFLVGTAAFAMAKDDAIYRIGTCEIEKSQFKGKAAGVDISAYGKDVKNMQPEGSLMLTIIMKDKLEDADRVAGKVSLWANYKLGQDTLDITYASNDGPGYNFTATLRPANDGTDKATLKVVDGRGDSFDFNCVPSKQIW